jgi:glycosyltransferase involved in cell wall biosynthesis
MMRRLKEIYHPSIVWVPNGSPWQCDHATGIREVFRDIPIVDQQAYDTEAGWIARYGDPGIQSYDRFVAINTKIRQVQVERYSIPAGKIDLIYHSINLDALGPMARTDKQRISYREKYNLPPLGKIFGWVGRLTRQKRPLEFLSFVKQHTREHFVMIGNGELASACDAFIAEQGIRNVTTVRFSNAMAELFSIMSGLLGTSEYEGLPISMLEAIAMGVPIFSTDVGDVGIILSEYECGAITPVAWDIDRYSADFLAWKERLPFQAADAATKIRKRFGGPSVATLYDSCFRTALSEFRAV